MNHSDDLINEYDEEFEFVPIDCSVPLKELGDDDVEVIKDIIVDTGHYTRRYRPPVGYRLVNEAETNLQKRLNKLEASIADLISSTRNDNTDMVSLSRAYLENCTPAQVFPDEGSESNMKLIRLRACVGYDADGNSLVTQVSGHTELELSDKITKTILQSGRASEFIPATDSDSGNAVVIPTFGEYAENWFTTFKVGRIKPTTASGYSIILRNHLYPTWRDTPINEIDAEGIQALLNSKADMAAKSLREIRTLLSSILDCAVRDGLMKVNPATDKRIRIPSEKKEVREALTVDELKQIIQSLDTLQGADRLYLALLIFTGERRGEVLGLRWEDIDLQGNVIHIRRGVTFPAGMNDPVITTPKTKSGYRDIPIMRPLLAYLLPARAEGYIIGGGDKPVTLSWHRRTMERIGKTIDLHGASAHIFRHSFATLLNDAGASAKTIQSIIGHADISTTLNRYVHAVDETKAKAIDSAENILMGD